MKDIKKMIDDLANEFESSSLYQDYLKAKELLQNNNEIMNVINDIKRLQKIAVNNTDKTVELKIEELNKKLNGYPLYQSYINIVDMINEHFFMINEQFNKYFHDLLEL